MKKLLIFLLGGAALCGCDEPTTNNNKLSVTANHGDWVGIGHETYICPMELFGHEYIITVMSCHSSHTVHAAHCPCRTNGIDSANVNLKE